jgi:hypothetical protein
MAFVLVLALKWRHWLTSHQAKHSGDPMSDACWKWGFFYFNPSDPALVVPGRTGIGQSFNCARPSVWVVGGAIAVPPAVQLIRFSRRVPDTNWPPGGFGGADLSSCFPNSTTPLRPRRFSLARKSELR